MGVGSILHDGSYVFWRWPSVGDGHYYSRDNCWPLRRLYSMLLQLHRSFPVKASTFAATTICVSFAFSANATVITPEEADVISRRCQGDSVCEANLRTA